MYLAYKYIRDKGRKAKAAQQAQAVRLSSPGTETTPSEDGPQTTHDTSDSFSTPQSSSKPSSSVQWKLLLMAALVVPVFFETLDYTVVATAQVHIASVFNRLDLQSYVGTIYLLTSTVFLPLFASLADIWGRHWALQLSLLLFGVGSAISTGAQSMITMLAGRGVAGIGAGGMMAIVRIILSDSNSLDDNNWQQSMLFALFTIGFCVGPVIGGALTTVSFRWIFAINLPCCVTAMVLSFFILRGRTKGSQPRHSHGSPDESTSAAHETFFEKFMRIDSVGAFLFMAAGITLLLALNWGSVGDWDSARVIACFVVAGVSYVAWVLWEYLLERKAAAGKTSRNPLMNTDPMIPMQVFTSFDVCAVQFAVFTSGMVMLVMFYFISIFFAIVGGLTGTRSGAQLLFFAPGLGAGSLTSMILVKRLRQPKIPIIIGGLIINVSLGLVSWAMDRNVKSEIDGFLVVAGVGVGMSIGPLAVHSRFSQPESRIAIISGLTLFSRALGGTVGLAQCGAVLNGKVTSSLRALLTSGTISAQDAALLQNGLESGITSVQGISSLPPEVQQYVRNAFQEGTRWAIISLLPWASVAFFLSLFLSNIRDTDKEARLASSRPGQRSESESEVKPSEGEPQSSHELQKSEV
ncbi:MFS general substrate transporter [Ganoderma sinense ZZ0214-1]|uniref:MFS general substrate transporter n=1 Tax=Ganoderma sinense ZZ0214-1 TaxID=1077348 RepID=A0A2G8SQP9_9APHY|nr:MFS general substrate transporter [Ganoderma sinense ZZ0214-1]